MEQKKKNGELAFGQVCSWFFLSDIHDDRPFVSDHSGADLGSGADPGPARVPGHQRGRSSGGECPHYVCLLDSY